MDRNNIVLKKSEAIFLFLSRSSPWWGGAHPANLGLKYIPFSSRRKERREQRCSHHKKSNFHFDCPQRMSRLRYYNHSGQREILSRRRSREAAAGPVKPTPCLAVRVYRGASLQVTLDVCVECLVWCRCAPLSSFYGRWVKDEPRC